MYFLTISFLIPFLITCKCKCDNKHDRTIQELKTDVEKIGSGFENLAFDVMEQIIEKVNGDYYMSDESASNEANTQQPTTKKIINNLLENTTQVYPPKKIATDEDKSRNRRKRSVTDNDITSNNISEVPMENAIVESSDNDTLCATKTAEEKILERQHIEDLKEEVKKLYDLVVLLKDQQKIMSLLDQETNHIHSDLSKRFDTKDLLKILDHVNNKDGLPKDSDNDINPKTSDDNIVEKSTHEELENIKIDLRAAIGALNKTKEILAMERGKELYLEGEIKDHKIELGFLKLMIQKLYENNTGFHTKSSNASDDILGAPPHLPKELPKSKLPENSTNKINDTNKALGRSATGVSQRRSSDLEDLDRIIHKLRKPKQDDIESRLNDLKREMEKKKKEEDLMKQLEQLQKFVAEKEELNSNSNSLATEDSTLKKLLEALKGSDRPQNKALDDDVEVELQKLQKAIDNLRPKEDQDIRPERDDVKQLRKLLNRVLKQESKDDLDVNLAKNQPLSSKQIVELKKQLDDMSPDKGKGGNINPGGGGYGYGYGYGPQFADLFGRGPPSQLFSGGGFSNYPHPYPPYNRILNGGGTYLPPNNPLGGYPPSGNGYQSQSFATSTNIRGGAAIGQGSSGYNRIVPAIQTSQSSSGGIASQNTYQTPPGSQQKQFEGSAIPSQYNFGGIQQSTSEQQQTFRGQLPINPYGAGGGVNQVYPGLSELHQKLFGANSAQNSLKPTPYSQASSGGQKEIKNQFFLAPQPPTAYGGPSPNPFYAQGGSGGGSQDKPGDYPQQNPASGDYRYQKIEDLRTQVDSLQNVINSLNKPDYVQKPEDEETIVGLERQINELKNIIQGLTQDLSSNQPNYGPNLPIYDQNVQQQQQQQPVYPRRRRSTEDNKLNPEDSDLYDQVVNKLKQMLFENDTRTEERSSSYYDDVQRKIGDLKSQLENHMHTSRAGQERHFNPTYPPNMFPHAYQPSYNQYGTELPTLPLKIKNTLVQQKKTDIFTSIVLKILDKLLAAAPAILQKLLGYGFGQLFSFDYDSGSNDYGSGYNGGYNVGYNGYNGIQGVFKSLGIFGYIPLVILKIIDGITAFFKILKKNKFFKNFLLPAFVLLLVAGSVLFLVWWLQPDGDSTGLEHGYEYNQNYDNGYKNYDYNKNYDRYPNNYQNGYNKPNYGYGSDYGYSRSPSYPVYSRSYFENRR